MTSEVLDRDIIAFPAQPELVIGLVAPIGTPLLYFKQHLMRTLGDRDYGAREIKLSDAAVDARTPGVSYAGLGAYERYRKLMEIGNEVRRAAGRDDVLALLAASQIAASRRADEPRHRTATAVVINQLKRPEEAFRLRKIYGEHFFTIGLHCPKDTRRRHLELLGMSEGEADELIAADENDAVVHGQRVVDTYHLADVFFEVKGNSADGEESARIRSDLGRFWDLVFGTDIVTPRRDEYGMYLAQAASLRSSSLARQVGAAILTAETEVLAVGANDVPCYPGGLYWGDEIGADGSTSDARDHIKGFDESDRMKSDMVREVLARLMGSWESLSEEEQKARVSEGMQRLKGTRLMSLTEFARAVHAEMEALSSAARVGVAVRGAHLYTTTFPCHNCAKHIVAAGIERVVFMEPYPKSRALQMYGDSIFVSGESLNARRDYKVHFEPFVGVAPRRFQDLFGRFNYEGRLIEVKDKQTGEVNLDSLRFRIPFSPFSYVLRESMAAEDVKRLQESIYADGQAANGASS